MHAHTNNTYILCILQFKLYVVWMYVNVVSFMPFLSRHEQELQTSQNPGASQNEYPSTSSGMCQSSPVPGKNVMTLYLTFQRTSGWQVFKHVIGLKLLLNWQIEDKLLCSIWYCPDYANRLKIIEITDLT